MKQIQKSLRIVLCICFIFCCLSIAVCALEYNDISTLEEIPVPDELNFTVNSTCSRHLYFLQAAAREDGSFIVYSRYVDETGYSEDTFNVVYIDVYDAEGHFIQELSFTTPFDLAVEMTEETINIYFYSNILVYNINDQELHNYSIPDGSVTNSGYFQDLREENFSCGDWQYRCVKSFAGYTKLLRSHENQEQLLVELPGTRYNFWNTGFLGVLVGMIVLLTLFIGKHKTKRNKRQE